MSDKWWSALFGVVMLACAALFVVAPFVGWWLPEGKSEHAHLIGELFYLILIVTGIFFVLTEALLVAFMFRYGEATPGEVRKPSIWATIFRPLYSLFNTSTKVELAWTVVPAAILVYLAAVQINTWAEVKYKSRLDANVWGQGQPMPVQVDLSARQFEWRFRYPSPATWAAWQKNPEKSKNWVKNPEFDDVTKIPNELHLIMDRHVVIHLSTLDVLHSFNMPHMRVKQDALPGKTIPVWFKPIDYNVEPAKDATGNTLRDAEGKVVRWEYRGGINPETGRPHDTSQVWQIACAELCGWGHYRMIGQCYVHRDEADFAAWLEWASARQHDFGVTEKKK